MSKRQWLTILGVWVIVFLFLGFPTWLKSIIAPVTGLIIIAISYNLPPEKKKNGNTNGGAFVENNIRVENNRMPNI